MTYQQLPKYSIFLIRDIKTNKKFLNPSFSKYSFPIFMINEEKYFCFLAKGSYSIDRIVSQFNNEFKINIDKSQVKGTHYINKNKNISVYLDDGKPFVYFYIWSIPDTKIKSFKKIVENFIDRGHYDCNVLTPWYYKIICEEHIYPSLIPIFTLLGCKISYRLGQVPVLSMYGGKLEDEFSKEEFEQKINEIAGPDNGVTRIIQFPFWHNSHVIYIVEFSDIKKCNDCYDNC